MKIIILLPDKRSTVCFNKAWLRRASSDRKRNRVFFTLRKNHDDPSLFKVMCRLCILNGTFTLESDTFKY